MEVTAVDCVISHLQLVHSFTSLKVKHLDAPITATSGQVPPARLQAELDALVGGCSVTLQHGRKKKGHLLDQHQVVLQP